MPVPRGRKSRPTKFSRTEDLPADCEPTTAIYSKVMPFVINFSYLQNKSYKFTELLPGAGQNYDFDQIVEKHLVNHSSKE